MYTHAQYAYIRMSPKKHIKIEPIYIESIIPENEFVHILSTFSTGIFFYKCTQTSSQAYY